MDASIAAILALDGVTTGAVYALLAIALVLIFTVTRVIFIPSGELVAYAALTMAALQGGKAPAAAGLTVALGVAVFAVDLVRRVRSRAAPGGGHGLLRSAAWNLVLPGVVFGVSRLPGWATAPQVFQVLLTLGILVPAGPMLYRLCFAPLRDATVLTLLIVAVALHFILLGLGLGMFGAEGSRTAAFTDARFDLGALQVTGQSAAVVVTSVAAMVLIAAFFGRTLVGKALRATAVNRVGARLVGIGSERAGMLAFAMGAALSAFSGVLIGPVTTVYYDTGFLVSLKGFVGAIVGGLAGYPLAVFGAVVVGLIESFASFWSSAYKEVIVFSLIVPVLAWRSFKHRGVEEDDA